MLFGAGRAKLTRKAAPSAHRGNLAFTPPAPYAALTWKWTGPASSNCYARLR